MKNKEVVKKVKVLSKQSCKLVKGGGVIETIDNFEGDVD